MKLLVKMGYNLCYYWHAASVSPILQLSIININNSFFTFSQNLLHKKQRPKSLFAPEYVLHFNRMTGFRYDDDEEQLGP
jgi:hypothetical protein